jgi:hypothetical protein
MKKMKQKLLTLLAVVMAIAIIMSTPVYAEPVTQEIPLIGAADDFEEEETVSGIQFTSSET